MRLEQWALVGHQEIFGSREIAQAITAAVRNRPEENWRPYAKCLAATWNFYTIGLFGETVTLRRGEGHDVGSARVPRARSRLHHLCHRRRRRF